MPSIGEELTSLCSTLLTGGLTQTNGVRKMNTFLLPCFCFNLPKNEKQIHSSFSTTISEASFCCQCDICRAKKFHPADFRMWNHPKFRWDYYMEGRSMFRNLNPMVAYEKGLTTWAKWVDLNLDPQRTRVIFRSMSPRHNRYSHLLLNFKIT